AAEAALLRQIEPQTVGNAERLADELIDPSALERLRRQEVGDRDRVRPTVAVDAMRRVFSSNVVESLDEAWWRSSRHDFADTAAHGVVGAGLDVANRVGVNQPL